MKTSFEIRRDFLEFFASKNHQIVNSAPIFPQDDPTLLFTNAGMNQFKDVFLGTGTRDYKRAADTQKCIRVSGKHNDLEVVGKDTYHHTFFEMLGNWSFGDYFKREAIRWAWELLTEVWEVPKDRLYATIFEGDPESGLEEDSEARQIWLEETEIPEERVWKLGKKDNFWEMGDTGPCGPCTEIHINMGTDEKPDLMEIWNLVFIQYNRKADGSLEQLPAKHVDTGMGFERIVALLQGKTSNYDIDIFASIMASLEEITGKKYREDSRNVDVAFQVIADHIRALSSAFADGALPGNTGRGYVLKRLLRRAARYGRQNLNMDEPFIYKLVPTVADIYADVFPEIKERQEHISLLIKNEEETFGKTLSRGISLFQNLAASVKEQQGKTIPGEKAYELYHRDGFPKDLVELMAEEEGMTLDQEGWTKAEEEHKARSKGEKFAIGDLVSELEGIPATRFLGYTRFKSQAKILKLVGTDKLILDRTTFYAQGGGQIGDKGVVTGKNFRFEVHDTQKQGDIFVHFGELIEGDLSQLPRWVSTRIDKDCRRKTMANHTATHLLHWALKEVLGSHANQQGSVVAPDRLRFDISHPQRISEQELQKIETLVNQVIYENLRVRSRVESLEEAKEKGATALFGEKYGESVRVISIGRYSMELCGGTHAFFTGNLGSFKIVSESAVQAGVRRIEAVTRSLAVEHSQKAENTLNSIKRHFKVNDDAMLLERLVSLQEEIKQLKKKSKQDSQRDCKDKRDELLKNAMTIQDVKVFADKVEGFSPEDLRTLGDLLRKSGTKALGLLTVENKGKLFMIAFVSDALLEQENLHAGEILRKACSVVGGGGNTKRRDFAQGQGVNASKMNELKTELQKDIEEKLSA